MSSQNTNWAGGTDSTPGENMLPWRWASQTIPLPVMCGTRLWTKSWTTNERKETTERETLHRWQGIAEGGHKSERRSHKAAERSRWRNLESQTPERRRTATQGYGQNRGETSSYLEMKDIGKETESGRDHRQSVGAEDTLSAGMAEGSCGAGIRRGVTGDKGSPEEHLREEASECGHPEHGIRGLQQAGQMESVDGEERGGNLWRLGTKTGEKD